MLKLDNESVINKLWDWELNKNGFVRVDSVRIAYLMLQNSGCRLMGSFGKKYQIKKIIIIKKLSNLTGFTSPKLSFCT